MEARGYLKSLHATDSHRSVFLFPGILGSLNGYSNVIATLRNSCSLFGLRYAINMRSEPNNAMQTLGALCAQHILDVSGSRTIHLVGWSMGGVVAYECGSAMHAQGRSAETIIMVDPAPQTLPESEILRRQSPDNGLNCAESNEFMWQRFLNFKCDSETVRELLTEHDFFAKSDAERFQLVEKHQKRWTTNILKPLGVRASFRFMSASYSALQAYVPSRYPGPIHVICSDAYRSATSLNWLRERAEVTHFVRVQGDHLTAILHFAIPDIVEIISRTPPR